MIRPQKSANTTPPYAIQALDGNALVNEGKLAEQFIGQHLMHPLEPPPLTYWLREGKSSNAEVDFAIAVANQIIPTEVKAGKSGALKSLRQFVLKKNAALCIGFDLNRPSIQEVTHALKTATGSASVTFTLLSLPLYLVEELPGVIDQIRNTQLLKNTARQDYVNVH